MWPRKYGTGEANQGARAMAKGQSVRTVTDSESARYRIVGRTLIINHDNYVINAIFVLDGDSLYMDTGKYNIELQRM
jgi:hypothetical protein